MLTRLLVTLAMLPRLLVGLLAVVAHERLLLLRHEARLLAEARIAVAVVVAVFGLRHLGVRARRLLTLPELLLRGRDDPVIVLSVLVVVLSCHRIAGGACIARKLDVFLGHVGGRAADLDVGSVRFVHPCQGILAAPVIVVVIVVVVIPVAHPLVVLTVSHLSPFYSSPEVIAVHSPISQKSEFSEVRFPDSNSQSPIRRAPRRTESQYRSKWHRCRRPSRSAKSRSAKTRSPTAAGQTRQRQNHSAR
ncbi:hypothetical protein ACVWW1_006095 [Bradyrhizobium sp. JR3.5]